MTHAHPTRRFDRLEASRTTTSAHDTMLPWADPYIADLQRADAEELDWPDRPHWDTPAERQRNQHSLAIRGEAPPPLNEVPSRPAEAPGRRAR